MRYALPLLLFVGLIVLLTMGLGRDPRELPSPLLGRTAPALELPQLEGARFDRARLHGKVWVLNVWASWCSACRAEHAALARLGREGGVALLGMAYKDRPQDSRAWLSGLGSPYAAVFVDEQGSAGIDWGVYGVPETFVIDRAGIIRARYAKPLSDALIETELKPLLRRLGSGA